MSLFQCNPGEIEELSGQDYDEYLTSSGIEVGPKIMDSGDNGGFTFHDTLWGQNA